MRDIRIILVVGLLVLGAIAVSAKDGRAGQEDDLHRIAVATEAIAKRLERCPK